MSSHPVVRAFRSHWVEPNEHVKEKGLVHLLVGLVPCVDEDVEFSSPKDESSRGIAEFLYEIGSRKSAVIREHDHGKVLLLCVGQPVDKRWLSVLVVVTGRGVVVKVNRVPFC